MESTTQIRVTKLGKERLRKIRGKKHSESKQFDLLLDLYEYTKHMNKEYLKEVGIV